MQSQTQRIDFYKGEIMSTFWLTVYILIWPVIAAGVFLTLCGALVYDIKTSRKQGRTLV